MPDAKDVTFEFNVFDDGRTHLKILGPGTPSVEFLLAAKGRHLDAVSAWDEAQESPETPPDDQEAPASPPGSTPAQREAKPRRTGGATEPQCNLILRLCHEMPLDLEEGVEKALTRHAGAEWKFDTEGRCIPDWGFLQGLTKKEASNLIEVLQRLKA